MVKKEGTRFYEEYRVFATCSPQNPVPRFFIVGWRRWKDKHLHVAAFAAGRQIAIPSVRQPERKIILTNYP